LTTFGVETICSQSCGVKKDYHVWNIGVATFLVTGLAFMFPFSSPATTTYTKTMPTKLKGLTYLLKSLLMLTLTILFAVMAISGYGLFPKIGDAGLLLILTSICSSLVPLPPLSGKAIYDWKKGVSAAILVPLLVLILAYEIQLLPLWTYSIVGICAVLLVPTVLSRLKKQRAIEKMKSEKEAEWCESQAGGCPTKNPDAPTNTPSG
jgi:hypothetical protein